MQVLLFISLCLHLGMAKIQTSSFLINSSLQYKSAHLWPSANQLYQRASAECVMTWLPSLMLSWLRVQCFSKPCQGTRLLKIPSSGLLWHEKLIFIWGNELSCKETFLYCFFTVSFSICRWNPGTDELHQRERKKAFGQAAMPVLFSIPPWKWLLVP